MKYKTLVICWAVIIAAVTPSEVYAGIGPFRAATPGSTTPDRGIDVAPSSITKETPSTSPEAASVTLIGPPIRLFGGTPVPCGDPSFWFDGPISPVSYRTGSTTIISLFAAFGLEPFNQQLVGPIPPSGDITTPLTSPNCTPSYTSHFNPDPQSFQNDEWLYGTFFNAGTTPPKMYSAIYNEFHNAPSPSPGATPTIWYTAVGLGTSTDFGATFSPIATPPTHIVACPTFAATPSPDGFFIGWAGLTSILLSPKDNLFYALASFSNVDHTVCVYGLMRTDNLDDPTSWRVWDGTNFRASFYPTNPAPGATPTGWDATANSAIHMPLWALYLGWSQYFQRFIAVGWANLNYPCSPVTPSWGFALSDDLVHWDNQVLIMNPPDPGRDGAFFGYPSLVDPSMLLNSSDSRAASNNYSGQTPYFAYSRRPPGQPQELWIQKLQFSGGPGPTPPVPVQNISIGGIVRPGDGNLIAGFEIGPGNPKTIIIRGLGPSLGGGLNTPTLTLYSSAGAPIKRNTGWRNNSSTDLALMSAVLPTDQGDCALVYGNFTAGFYSVVLSGGTIGSGLIELYDVTLQSTTSSLNSKLKSFSGRGYVTATGPMTMGLLLGAPRRGVLRATSLSTLRPPLSPLLPDPILTLYDHSGMPVASNDNWMDDPDHTAIQQSGHAPGNQLESAMYPSMVPSPVAHSWTASVSGHDGQKGYALLEFFDLTCVDCTK